MVKKRRGASILGKRSAQSVAGAAAFWVSEGFGLDELPWETLTQ